MASDLDALIEEASQRVNFLDLMLEKHYEELVPMQRAYKEAMDHLDSLVAVREEADG